MMSVPKREPNQCTAINAYSQHRFLLILNNHAQTLQGFVLTFSGTATLCNTIGIPEMKSVNKFFLYPNPTDGMLRLKNLPAKNNLAIAVINVYGNKVYGKEVKGSADNQLNLPP